MKNPTYSNCLHDCAAYCGGSGCCCCFALAVGMVVGSWETNQVFNRAERVERVYGGESGFNAEKAEAQEAQRGEGGDFSRVDGGAVS